MNFAIAAPLLSLCLSLMFGLGGCTTLNFWRSYEDFHDERHGRVITDTTAKLERDPYDAGLYVARGKAYYCKRQYEKALSDFNQAIEIDSENAEAYRGRGSASKMVDYQALAVKRAPYTHKGHVEDTKKADILEPGKLDEDINQGFGYISNVTSEFIYPVTGVCFAGIDLILGSTTKTLAAEMLPPDPYYAYGPTPVYRPAKPRIGKVGKVVDNARYNYEPYIEQYFSYGPLDSLLLVFDNNDKLVVIRSFDSMFLNGLGNERLKKIARKRHEKYRDLMRQYQFAEVYRETILDDYKVMRAEITPCVTVDISVPVEPEPTLVMYNVEYIYTCPTK